MNLQSTSQKQSLKSEPKNVLPENHKAPQMQTTGYKAPLRTEPSNVRYGANTPNGQMQISGDQIKLNKTPKSGYESASTPMSNRAEDSKKGY